MNIAHRVFEGIRVVDFTRVMSGPLCTAMLADLGADVIKIEDPRGGDITRHVPPFVGTYSAYFAFLNRNKKSVVLDLKSDPGRDVARGLMAGADVVIENFRPGVMDRLGLGWDETAYPNLIYASISGFGQSSTLAQVPAYDLVVQALCGLMQTTGEPDKPATAVGESITDAIAGLTAAWSIAAALFDRERTGRGRYLDVAMVDSVLSLMATNVSQQLNSDAPAKRRGNRHPATCPVDSISASDGEFVLVCFGDVEFKKLADAIDRPGLKTDPRFDCNEARLANERVLKKILEDWAGARTVDSAVAVLRKADLPCAPIWSVRDLVCNGYPDDRGITTEAQTADGGNVTVVRQPVDFAGTETLERPTIPGLGADTETVLASMLGLDDRAISDLRANGCFGTPRHPTAA